METVIRIIPEIVSANVKRDGKEMIVLLWNLVIVIIIVTITEIAHGMNMEIVNVPVT